jgi:acetyl esterase/lipase
MAKEAIDPELLPALAAVRRAALPGPGLGDLSVRRRYLAEVTATALAMLPPDAELRRRDVTIRAHDGALLPVRVLEPAAVPSGPRPGVLAIHAGGLVSGSLEQEDPIAAELVRELGCTVVLVGYRLAPEHVAPTAVEDCYAAWEWLRRDAARLGVDPGRLVLFGRSAGGGLAAAVALLARHRSGPRAVLQVLAYPMLDDRNATASSREITDVGIWDRAHNVEAWGLYLGRRVGGPDVTEWEAPARAEDLSGLPPTVLEVGTVDVFRDEVIDYGRRLMASGVPTELHVWPGVYHAGEKFAPNAAISRRVWQVRMDAMRTALR